MNEESGDRLDDCENLFNFRDNPEMRQGCPSMLEK
jgi:hypothetical protein